MRDGFLKVAAATPDIRVADCEYNAQQIMRVIEEANKKGVKLLVLPELCLTGYTCEDLFWQNSLISGAVDGLLRVRTASEGCDMLVVVGMPFQKQGKLYNVAAVVQNGHVLGLVPKLHLPNYSEFYEARHFHPGKLTAERIVIGGEQVLFGANLLFCCEEFADFVLGIEICEDLWTPVPPSGNLAMAGAMVIANLSASDETTEKANYRRELVRGQSARTATAYIYADAGEGESTTDLVFAAHNLIAENGTLLAESTLFENGLLCTEIDLQKLISERRRISTFVIEPSGYERVGFSMPSLKDCRTELTRRIDKAPFVPSDPQKRGERCSEIIRIQAMGLKKRLRHTGCRNAVLGISGGLDSTLALLVTCKAFELCGLDKSGILAVTMPCFGTTDRTLRNACALTKQLGATLVEIDIKEAVSIHLRDIGHPEEVHDVTYENAQARERTQLLMDIANKHNGMVIGTGDLSELALGWTTYNGDHMSMYGVNASVPKTLVRYLVGYFADETEDEMLASVLRDVLDTPVSPELLPPKEGEIAQRTEDIVGPYELHDFFLYYMMRFGFAPGKIYRMAVYAFDADYSEETILKWLKTFYRRFFSQQFKRSCLPDGPKVGSVALSPRGDWRMPSDACVKLWMQELEQIGQSREN